MKSFKCKCTVLYVNADNNMHATITTVNLHLLTKVWWCEFKTQNF